MVTIKSKGAPQPTIHIHHYHTSFGSLHLAEDGAGICGVFFRRDQVPAFGIEGRTPLLSTAIAQLDEYFAGTRTTFDLPLSYNGSAFQMAVWHALMEIPYGETRSYNQLAEAVGNPNAGRAVGMANNRNPIAIIIPCHRVVGKDGKLVGYAGGLDIKHHLLELESRPR